MEHEFRSGEPLTFPAGLRDFSFCGSRVSSRFHRGQPLNGVRDQMPQLCDCFFAVRWVWRVASRQLRSAFDGGAAQDLDLPCEVELIGSKATARQNIDVKFLLRGVTFCFVKANEKIGQHA